MQKGRRDLARTLRHRATDAERTLWRHMRSRLALEGTYFRRQVPIGPFIVDFACFKHRLVVELDGSQHGAEAALRADERRTAELEKHGFRVMRFWNHQVFTEADAVMDTIHVALVRPLLSQAELACHADSSEALKASLSGQSREA